MSLANNNNSINQVLETKSHWLNSNKIKVNTHKKYHIVFSYRNKYLLPHIWLGRETIAQTESTKIL